ncbi:hypothetical protein AVEN_143906-1 [Araneus ventricosus]|uniref:Uncharacterized protein n=1 Tax=Araneus ventricosus TaxID=182803 RepID=A0A4Y2EJP9_ARAVE|nr:hypothetical protein AVEN_143906-1 [Araneus ventricosus]
MARGLLLLSSNNNSGYNDGSCDSWFWQPFQALTSSTHKLNNPISSPPISHVRSTTWREPSQNEKFCYYKNSFTHQRLFIVINSSPKISHKTRIGYW